eukprot:2372234-Alexandrium_andersonii.AAC.1
MASCPGVSRGSSRQPAVTVLLSPCGLLPFLRLPSLPNGGAPAFARIPDLATQIAVVRAGIKCR